MPVHLRHIGAAWVIAIASVAIAACGGGSSGPKNNDVPTVIISGTVTPRAPLPTRPAGATPDDSIRTIDLRNTAPVQAILTDTNGQFVQTDVIYGDLNGDGVTDAIVPIESGGTQGTLAYVVLTLVDGKVRVMPMQKGDSSSGGATVQIVDGKLVDTRAEFAPNDANCCPSMLRKTTYKWDGTQFVVESSVTTANTTPAQKPTANADPQH